MGTLIRFRRKRRGDPKAERPLFPPVASDASDARPARFPSDAASSPELPRAGAPVDPEFERKRRRRRHMAIAALCGVFLGGTAAAFFGERGYLDVRRQRRAFLAMKLEVAAHQDRLHALKREVERLRADPRAVERIAREELGYTEPGEITLLLPGGGRAGSAALDAAPAFAIVPAVRTQP